MALQTSGPISLGDIHVEAAGSPYAGTSQSSLNDADIRGLTAASGYTINSTSGTQISIGDFYGASSFTATNTITEGTYSSSYTYYGFFTTGYGSVSPTNWGMFTITQAYMRISSSNSGLDGFVIKFSSSQYNIADNVFASVSILTGSGIVTLTSAEAFKSSTPYTKTWNWQGTSYGLDSTERSWLASQIDGSGTTGIRFNT